MEDEAALELLTSFNCDVVQGYLISKPKPANELSLERGVPSRGRRAPGPQHEQGQESPRPDLTGGWGYEPLPSSSNP